MIIPRPLHAGFLSLLLLGFAPSVPRAAAQAWREVPEQGIQGAGERHIVPTRYRTLVLDRDAMDEALGRAPMDAGEVAIHDGEVIHLPLPDGSTGRFLVQESPIMEPELAAKYPQIRTYRGQGLDDPSATLRLDRTPSGLHAMILSASGSAFIDPYQRHDAVHHISYYKRDLVNPHGDAVRCRFDESTSQASPQFGAGFESSSAAESLPSGSLLRTYRTAVATTGEYTRFHGGQVVDGLAAVVTAMNRVNGIYEREVAIRMILVADNDQIIYTKQGRDPYTNQNGSIMLSQNQDNLDTVIGSGNYDLGHVFSTGGGGVAYLGVTCNSGFKAGGVTGLPSPIGDPFYVDFVAHELGHQWGGNHSFNGNEGSCSGGNRNAGTAYEPGSASTIMGYAGICGSQNLQSNSDPYFHTISYEEIVNFSQSGGGSFCAATVATGNSAPVVEAGLMYTIPVSTPFTLCGSATDAEGDPLTYAWEQFDLGPAGHPDSPSGDAPLFRSFNPGEDPCRTFPRLSDLANGTSTIGELLPSYARTLNFRLTARDNRSGGGGADYDTTTVDVIDTAGPFQVTAPDGSAVWNGADLQAVTWDVAGTHAAPVSCSHVDILFSQDGGNTFPFTLLGGTPNDGSQQVIVPNVSTSQARVLVRCADNLFFNVSEANFTIVETAGVTVGTVRTLFVKVAPAGDFFLDWSFSCVAGDADYQIYQGSFDDFTSYAPLACSTGGNTSFTLPATPESTFYLIVPRKIVQEGGYGEDGSGTSRPASADACLPQLSVGCP